MITACTISVGGMCKVVVLVALFSFAIGLILGSIWKR